MHHSRAALILLLRDQSQSVGEVPTLLPKGRFGPETDHFWCIMRPYKVLDFIGEEDLNGEDDYLVRCYEWGQPYFDLLGGGLKQPCDRDLGMGQSTKVSE